jgi:hypothetical protein
VVRFCKDFPEMTGLIDILYVGYEERKESKMA